MANTIGSSGNEPSTVGTPISPFASTVSVMVAVVSAGQEPAPGADEVRYKPAEQLDDSPLWLEIEMQSRTHCGSAPGAATFNGLA